MPGSGMSPCAACKLLRRRCARDCVFAPHFPPDEPQKFANVHKVFGAANVNKMLQVLSHLVCLSPNCNSANVKLWKIFDDNSHPQSKSHFHEVADHHKDEIIDFTCILLTSSLVKVCQLLRKLSSQKFDFGICIGEAPSTGLYKEYPDM